MHPAASLPTYGRTPERDTSGAIQLYALPVVPGHIERRSFWSVVFSVCTFGVYALLWFWRLRDQYQRALTREVPDGLLKAILAFCTCGFGALPSLYEMYVEACRIERRPPQIMFWMVAWVPLVGPLLALAHVQRVLSLLETHVREAHGHTRLG